MSWSVNVVQNSDSNFEWDLVRTQEKTGSGRLETESFYFVYAHSHTQYYLLSLGPELPPKIDEVCKTPWSVSNFIGVESEEHEWCN